MPPLADREDVFRDPDLNDFQYHAEEEGEDRLVDDDRNDVAVASEIAEAIDILSESRPDGSIITADTRLCRIGYLGDQEGGENEGRAVDRESRVDSPGARHAAADRGAESKHDRPGCRPDRVRDTDCPVWDDVGGDGATGRKEDPADGKLNSGQRVEQPCVPGVPDEKETCNDEDTQDVAADQDVFPVVAIREYTPAIGLIRKGASMRTTNRAPMASPEPVSWARRVADAMRLNQSPSKLTIWPNQR